MEVISCNREWLRNTLKQNSVSGRKSLNIAQSIANSICLVARKLELQCALQILNE